MLFRRQNGGGSEEEGSRPCRSAEGGREQKKLAEEKLASVGTLEQENSKLKTALEIANREVSQLKKDKMVLHDQTGELAGKVNDLEAYLGGLAKKLFVMLEGNYSNPAVL